LFRAAINPTGATTPAEDYKSEGEYGRFFGDDTFDPQQVIGHLKSLPIRTAGTDLEAFSEHNL
ncbi:MAG: hypothetical protein AAF405_05215, partial [Pseudomonadota bacterium]